MTTCWVLTDARWPHNIKAASDSWHRLWQYGKEEAVNHPISLLQTDANAFASSMLMRRFHHNEQSGTRCTNSNKFGQLYSHVTHIVKHPLGLLAISSDISEGRRLRRHEQFAEAHAACPRLAAAAIAVAFHEVARHMGAAGVSHDQRFLDRAVVERTTRPPALLNRAKKRASREEQM